MLHGEPVVGGPVAEWRRTGGQGIQPSQYSTPPQDQANEQHCKYSRTGGEYNYAEEQLTYMCPLQYVITTLQR